MEEHKSQKMLWIVLSFLCVAIVGLVVGIVVMGSQSGSDGLSSNWELQLEEELDGLGLDDIEEGISIYQGYIDMADINDKAKLYAMRARWITGLDPKREYKEQVIADIIEADNILQTVDSATDVISIASSYGDGEVVYEYIDIKRNRQLSEGFTMEQLTEVEG